MKESILQTTPPSIVQKTVKKQILTNYCIRKLKLNKQGILAFLLVF
jgi:hypothetical protein